MATEQSDPSPAGEDHVPPEVAARNLAALQKAEQEAERPLNAAAVAYCSGVVPVVVAVLFGLPFGLVLVANVIGAVVAAWRASTRTPGRILSTIPALGISLGVSIASWSYVLDSTSTVMHVDELLWPCTLGAIPGAILWWVGHRLFSRTAAP